ncbi:MAG: acyl-CoA dehydrogenase family protein [Acidimicrobiia bacterium]|nr:acyl-CoA dehydrogenase family protein [Acidimicrobiia bacterium]
MHFDYPEHAEQTRQKAQAFLAEHLPPDWRGTGALDGEAYEEFITSWRSTLYEHGWLGLTWPTEYGGAGLTDMDAVVVAEEFAKAGVPTGGRNDAFSVGMLGNTILRLGTEEQKQHFLPKALSGKHVWCQGYSEPDSGSDLGSVGTKAVLDGDEWVINGQKIWTSAGHLANWIFILCRTDPAARKHKGISFLLCSMDQPGVEVRPIKMLSGDSEFNEVFFTDARAPRDHVIGAVNEGWRVAMALLGYERGKEAATAPIMFQKELDRLLEYATELGSADDPLIRQRLSACYEKVEIMKYMGYAALTRFEKGTPPGPESAVFKLWWSEYHREVTELAMDIMGAKGLVPEGRYPASAFRTDSPGAANSTASWQTVFLNARAGTIYAGTSEIQRNIVGEMLLGLPKEPRPR